MFDFLAIILSTIITLILAIVVSGFFLWIALKLVGEERGIIEAGIANIVAGVVSWLSYLLLAFIPPLLLFFPVILFLVYTYILKSMLDINYVKAIAVAIISGIIFWIVTSFLVLLFCIPVIKPPTVPGAPHPRMHNILF